eukprot:g4929.t1
MVDGVPENRTAEFQRLNPAATTPFVELEDGTVLSESMAICRYADALYPGAAVMLCGGPGAQEAAQCDMWQRRVELQIISAWQRQFQYGEGSPYFAQHVPWVEASTPSVPGLRKQVEANLEWLEVQMAARAAAGGPGAGSGFIGGTETFTAVDLQLITTADFMGKVNSAKRTEAWDGRGSFGPWLAAWAERMRGVVQELKPKPKTKTPDARESEKTKK